MLLQDQTSAQPHARDDAAAAERFQVAIEAAPTGMLMVDAQGRITLVNAQVERVFGYRREELLGQQLEVLLPERFRARHPDLRAAFLTDARVRPMGAGRDLYGRRRDGSEVPIEIGLNPLTTPEGRVVLASIVDITERKRAEGEREELLGQLRALNGELEQRVSARTVELTAALKEREVLLQEVHHRVKNNLQVISSLINLQMRGMPDAASREALRDCKTRVEAMALIHQKLYQSRDYAHVPFSSYARTLAGEILAAAAVSPATVALEVVVDDLPLPVDQAIPCGLILNELVTNAVKHAFPHGERGSVRVELRAAGAREIVLAVSDDGVGMPVTFDAGRSDSLGMQLVHMLVKQLEGRIEIRREGGTAVRITFPREPRA
jgi:PAS domain S-box-containing protein